MRDTLRETLYKFSKDLTTIFSLISIIRYIEKAFY